VIFGYLIMTGCTKPARSPPTGLSRWCSETQLQYSAMHLGVFELLRAREQQIQAALVYVDTLLD
jgi:hypothetical protein